MSSENTETQPAADETQSHTTAPSFTTAADKIANTLREISKPEPGAGELELMLGTIAMGLEQGLSEQLEASQASGELDDFVLKLTQFMAIHRSDDARQLIVVEVPRHELPPGTRLHLLDEAARAMENVDIPW